MTWLWLLTLIPLGIYGLYMHGLRTDRPVGGDNLQAQITRRKNDSWDYRWRVQICNVESNGIYANRDAATHVGARLVAAAALRDIRRTRRPEPVDVEVME
jgi:hypothetical protein